MSESKKPLSKEEIDELLSQALPNGDESEEAVKKRSAAYKKITQALSGLHDPAFPKELIIPQGKTSFEILLEYLRKDKKKN